MAKKSTNGTKRSILPRRDQLDDRGARRRQNAGARFGSPHGVMQKARPQKYFSSSTCGKVPLSQPAQRRALLRVEGENFVKFFSLVMLASNFLLTFIVTSTNQGGGSAKRESERVQ